MLLRGWPALLGFPRETVRWRPRFAGAGGDTGAGGGNAWVSLGI